MEKTDNIRSLLGLSQVNLALLLKVSRSQIAMYELGKRNLPLHAMEMLTIMLSHSQKETTKIEVKTSTTIEEQNFLKKLLLKNSHQQLLVERKIRTLEKKQNILETSKKIISHLLKDNSNMKKSEIAILKAIAVKSKSYDTQNYTIDLLQLELKKEVLVFEEKLLQKKMK